MEVIVECLGVKLRTMINGDMKVYIDCREAMCMHPIVNDDLKISDF